MTDTYKTSLALVSKDSAEGQARALLDKAEAALGFIPNMYAAMANAPGVLDTYLHGYEHFRNNSGFSAPEQEVVFLVISRENGCPYCLAAHSMLADKQSKVPEEVIQAIRDSRQVPDEKLAALADFTAVMMKSRGNPDPDAVKAFQQAGFEDRHILDIILAQAVKTLSNYSNHLFHTPVDDLFADYRV